ncbi:MAG: CDP-glycerol glycerophosphotransferase family protein [Pseudomonadota bacterium]
MTPRLKDWLRPVLVLTLWVGSYLVPKRKSYLAFLAGHDKGKFDGNLKWLNLYLQQTAPEIDTVWLTDNTRVATELKRRNIPFKKYKLFPIWPILRAQTIFIDTRHYSLGAGRFSIVQLWHGTGFKSMTAASAFKSRLKAALGRNHYSKYVLVSTTSANDTKEKEVMFGGTNNHATGYPRNDIFFGGIFDKQKYKEEIGVARFEKLVVYAPTFRDHGEFEPFSDGMWKRINQLMVNRNELFIVKKHPGDKKLQVPPGLSNTVDMTADIKDVQELLAASDVLITDYSTIVTDYALSRKPAIFYTFDLAEYRAHSRPLTEDFDNVLPGPFANDEEELFALLEDASWFHDAAYQDKYSRFVSHYHTHQDSGSCRRVMEHVMDDKG